MRLACKAGAQKQLWVLDSIASIQTAKVINAGSDGRNMNLVVDRATYLSYVLPKWAGLAANYNALIIMINQLRKKPGVMYGSPEYTPGGEAVPFVSSVQARVRKGKNNRITEKLKTVGIRGRIVNIKNRAGGGSVQDEQCAFEIRWKTDPIKVKFMAVEEAEE